MRPRREPGPAVAEAVEPVDDVPFEELLRGMQEDLLAGDARVHPQEVDRVLQLVAEAERPGRLVEPPPGPDPLGEGLVLDPVEVAVEVVIVAVATWTVPMSAVPPAAGGAEPPGGELGVVLEVAQQGRDAAAVVGLAEDDGQARGAARRDRQGVQEGRDRAVIGQIGGGRRPGIDDEGGAGDVERGAEEPTARGLDRVGGPGRGGERGPFAVVVAGVLEEEGVAPGVGADRQWAGGLGLSGQDDLEV